MQHNALMDRPQPASLDAPAQMQWFEAIARRMCVTARYNGTDLMLAPHHLYARGDNLYIAAAAIARRGLPVLERKIGIFALAGLRDATLTDEPFEIEPTYDPVDARWATGSLFAVEA